MALDDIKQSVKQNLAKAYDKALDKGATEPENKNLENLATTIDSIQGGTTLGYNVRSVINEDGETQTLKIISGKNILLQDKTVTPTEDQQTITADEGYFAIENMIVEAIPSDYIGSDIQKVEENTYTPTTTDIVIDGGQYLNGSQIIKGDANLVSENIADGVELFGLRGSHKGGGENDVITVDKLPEEDVNSAKVYKTNKIENQLVIYYTGAKPIPFKNIVNVTQVLVNDINSVTTPQADEPFVYVDTASGIGYLYTNENENVVQMTAGQIMELPDKGYIEHLDETSIVESGIYYTPLEVTEYGIPNNDNYDNRQVKKYIYADAEIGYQWQKMEVVSGGTNITKNGHYNVTPYETVEVNVPSSEPDLIAKEITENGKYNASDDGVDGYSSINVNVASGGGDLNVAQRTLGALDFSDGDIELLPNFSMGGVLDLSKDIKVTNDDDTGAYDDATGYYRFYIPNSNDVDIYAKVYFSVPIDGDVTFDLYGKEGTSYNDKYIAVSNLDSVIPKKNGPPDEADVYSLVEVRPGVTVSSTVTFNNVPAGEHFVTITAGVSSNASFELLIKSVVVPENTSDATALSKLTIVKPLALKPENIVGGNVVMGVMGNAGTMATAINDGTTEIFDTGAVTTIRPYAFYQHSTLTNVSFPACSSIGISAFQLCSQLSSANFPKCQYIGSSAFANCTKLTNVSFPAVVSLGTEIWRSAPISRVYLPECSDVGTAFRNATAIKAIDLPKVTKTAANCFGGMTLLVSANLPECSYLGSGAFSSCNNLTDLNIPKLTSLSGTAQFFSCYKLSYFNMGNISSITGTMFGYCSALSSVDADNVTYVGTQAFVGCRTLPTINLPQCSVVSNGAFTNCSVLTTVNIPLCEQLGSGAFSSCSALTTINMPLCEQIGSYAFYSCSALTKIDLPVASSIGSRAFYFCSKLSTIIIGSSSCRLWNTDALQQTPMNNSTYLGYFGSIYVPADYVDYYKTSQYWSTYSLRITSIENLPTE